MKKFIATIVLIALLFSLSACSKSNVGTPQAGITTQERSGNDENVSTNNEFASIDNAIKLKMKMYGDYFCTQDGYTHRFFDGKVVVSYMRLYDLTTDETPKDIKAFEDFISLLFKSRIFINDDGSNFKFSKDKEINGFKVKEFNGTITDSHNVIHSCKAYTFICGGYDCIVIAAPIENTDEMIEKMNKDIDIFMNNLEVDK